MPPPTGVVALDGNEILAAGVERLLREPRVRAVDGVRLLAGVHFLPFDLARVAVGGLHGRVPHDLRRARDVGSRAVALDERDDGVRGHDEAPVLHDDLLWLHKYSVSLSKRWTNYTKIGLPYQSLPGTSVIADLQESAACG